MLVRTATTSRPEDGDLHAYIEYDPQTRTFVGVVPGAHSQAETLDELRDNRREVMELCLEEHGDLEEMRPSFVGLQQIEIG